MEYKYTTPIMKGLEVRKIQEKLNMARQKAQEVVRMDISMSQFMMDRYYFQEIHHYIDMYL